MKASVKIWAPATVANLSVGFDALGCALASPGETLIMRRTPISGEVKIVKIEGADLDMEAEKNVSGVAAISLLKALGNPCGLELELYKQVKPGSGLGSSASSAASAVVALNTLLDAGLRGDELIPFALDGEQIASGARHADNVAPAILGGLVLCGAGGSIQRIPIPPNWHLVLLHPQVEVHTSAARAVLPQHVALSDAVRQNAAFASFIASCYEGDGPTAALTLEDVLVGPYREPLIPHFAETRSLGLRAGARAVGIAGSGPSSFYVAMNEQDAGSIARVLSDLMTAKGMPYEVYVTQIASRGAHEID